MPAAIPVLLVVIGGVPSVTVQAISSGSKVQVGMDATTFPLSDVTMSIGISTDNQANYRTASMKCPSGILPRDSKWAMSYRLGETDVPTHTKVTIDSTLGFSSNMTIEVL